MPGIETYQVYKEFGVAALFIVMYVTTVWFLIRTLVQDRAKEIKRTETVVELIVTSNAVLARNTEILEKLKETIENEERRSSELLTYLRTKDEMGKGRRDSR
jgi:tRNA(Phe) wybutosine-synthesizing methylase Tyw3